VGIQGVQQKCDKSVLGLCRNPIDPYIKKARVMAVSNQPSLIGGTVLVDSYQRSKFQGFWRDEQSATSTNINSHNSKTCFSESKNGQIYILIHYLIL
jgi:hypothetical protein